VALSQSSGPNLEDFCGGAALVPPFSVFAHLPARTDEVFE
jgi:hypothetical protein